MKHRNIIHRIIVDKEMMIKGIAGLLYMKDDENIVITKKSIRGYISWVTWYNGYGAMEDQMPKIIDLYPEAIKIYNKLYPAAK